MRYLPIAGHKVDTNTQFMAANDAIEVALRPVPSANVFVPYLITFPPWRLRDASSPSAWRSYLPASRRSPCCIECRVALTCRAGRLDQLWQLFSCALALNILRPGVLWHGAAFLTSALDLVTPLCNASATDDR